MFIALMYCPYESNRDPLPYQWVFYKLINSFSSKEIVFIADSGEYFSDPKNFTSERSHAFRDDAQKIYGYTIPSIEKINQYKRIIINPFDTEEANKFKTEGEYRIYTSSNLSAGLVKKLNMAYLSIKKMGLKPTAFLYHGDIPSVRLFCKKTGLPFISSELGPFRNWTYTNNSIFSIGGFLNIEITKKRYRKFKKEIVTSSVPIYEKKEIMSIFLEEEYEDELNDQLPKYDLGIIFPYSLVQKDYFEKLLNIAQNYDGSVLGRLHPTDVNTVNVKNIMIDDSAKSLDFIKKCKRIVTCGSNVTIEALLLDKVVFDISNSHYSWITHSTVSNTLEQSCDLEIINFYFFCIFIPFELCHNKKYIDWRLTNPSETDIYIRHLNYWKKLRSETFSKRIDRVKEDLTAGSLEERIINQITRKNSFLSNELNKLNIELTNKTEQFIKSERMLKTEILEYKIEIRNIKASKTYKLASKIASLSRKILPPSSKRRQFAKFIYHLLRHQKTKEKEVQPAKKIILLQTGKIHKKITKYEPINFKEEATPVVSIIIPVYNQFNYTYNCLKSIYNNSGNNVRYEIIIADDCSNDRTTQIKEIITNINVVKPATNLGFLKNCNNAAKYAKGKYILFLNNDTQVQENWLSPLVELMEKDETIGLTGSKLVFPDNTLQEAGGIVWRDASTTNHGRDMEPDLPEYNFVRDADYLSGASILVRRQLWETIGGFDEQFAPAYCEDVDLAFSIRKLGYRTVYQPESIVVHFENVSDLTGEHRLTMSINQKKIYKKWQQEIEKDHFPPEVNIF